MAAAWVPWQVWSNGQGESLPDHLLFLNEKGSGVCSPEIRAGSEGGSET